MLILVALAWIGRGDYSGEGWNEARSVAAEVRGENFPDYLVGMP